MVDVIVSGEVYHSLGLLRRVVALAMDLDMRGVDPEPVRSHLRELLQAEGPRSGRSLIVLVDGDDVYGDPREGAAINLATLSPPDEAFAIRSRFPIYTDAASGKVQWTAHVTVLNALNSSAASNEAGQQGVRPRPWSPTRRVGDHSAVWARRETRTSIDETITMVSGLIDERLIDIASPNILACHPVTPITRAPAQPNDGKVIA